MNMLRISAYPRVDTRRQPINRTAGPGPSSPGIEAIEVSDQAMRMGLEDG